jgi:acetoin utilization protein AcuC
MPGRASGFCVYNDAAVAIHAALARGAGRVLYVDIDAHHGDGVQTIFYRDPRVLTISIHESGRFLFPGTGFAPEIGEGPGTGFCVNVPLDPDAGDDIFIEAIERVVAPLARVFRPDLMVTQNGCDAHAEDPLTHLALSLEGHARAVTALHDLAHEVCGGRIAALGGGGYSIFRVVPRAWTRAFAILAHRDLQPLVPSEWREACQAAGGWDVPEFFAGEEETRSPEDVLYGARESIEWIEENVFPLHGLGRAERG